MTLLRISTNSYLSGFKFFLTALIVTITIVPWFVAKYTSSLSLFFPVLLLGLLLSLMISVFKSFRIVIARRLFYSLIVNQVAQIVVSLFFYQSLDFIDQNKFAFAAISLVPIFVFFKLNESDFDYLFQLACASTLLVCAVTLAQSLSAEFDSLIQVDLGVHGYNRSSVEILSVGGLGLRPTTNGYLILYLWLLSAYLIFLRATNYRMSYFLLVTIIVAVTLASTGLRSPFIIFIISTIYFFMRRKFLTGRVFLGLLSIVFVYATSNNDLLLNGYTLTDSFVNINDYRRILLLTTTSLGESTLKLSLFALDIFDLSVIFAPLPLPEWILSHSVTDLYLLYLISSMGVLMSTIYAAPVLVLLSLKGYRFLGVVWILSQMTDIGATHPHSSLAFWLVVASVAMIRKSALDNG